MLKSKQLLVVLSRSSGNTAVSLMGLVSGFLAFFHSGGGGSRAADGDSCIPPRLEVVAAVLVDPDGDAAERASAKARGKIWANPPTRALAFENLGKPMLVDPIMFES